MCTAVCDTEGLRPSSSAAESKDRQRIGMGMRHLTPPAAGKAALAALAMIMITATACAAGNDEAAATKVIKDYFAKPAEFSPGIMHDKVTVTVSEASATQFRVLGPRKIDNVVVKKVSFSNKKNREATADITFRLASNGVGCNASAVLVKRSSSWALLTFTVVSCAG